MRCWGARAPTGGVVADVGVGAGAGLVVGEDGGEVGVAARAGEGAGGPCGVARLLCAVVPLYEGHVVLHQRHLLPHHRAVPRLGLLHPDVLGRTWICQAKKNRKAQTGKEVVVIFWKIFMSKTGCVDATHVMRWLSCHLSYQCVRNRCININHLDKCYINN